MAHRIAMVLCSPFPAPRGTQGYVSDLSAALAAAGHEVHLFCHAGARGGRPPPGVTLHRARALPAVPAAVGSSPSPARVINDALVLLRLLEDLPALAPTVLHAHNHEAAVVAAAAGRLHGVPVVYQVHGALAEELPAWLPLLGPLVGTLGSLADHLVPRLADAVAALDGLAAARLDRPGRRPVVLPPGVHPFEGAPRDLGPGCWAAYAGNLDPYQDLPLLFDAFRRVETRLHCAHLALVTHDPPAAVRRVLRRSAVDRVRAVEVEDVAAARRALAGARVSVVPRREAGGYPIKLLNALGAGVPVVAARAAAKGLGPEDGVLPVDPEADALADALLRVLTDDALHGELAGAARRFAAAHPWSAVADAVTRLYERAGRRAG